MPSLIKPIISEKSMREVAGQRYTFHVQPQANKPQIKGDVEKLFGVKVQRVATGHGRGGKKAVVTLKPNQKVEGLLTQLFEAQERGK